MSHIGLDGYLLKQELDLKRIADFFGIKPDEGAFFVHLDNKLLNRVFKVHAENREAFVFAFGCVVFVDCSPSEAGIAIQFLEGLFGKIDYKSVLRYHHTHALEQERQAFKICSSEKSASLARPLAVKIASIVLARSIALSQVEHHVEDLLEDMENYLTDLKKGYLRYTSRRFMASYLEILKTQLRAIDKINILDTDFKLSPTICENQAFEDAKAWFELKKRYENVSRKIQHLNGILSEYMELAHKDRILLQDILTMALLFLFPLSYLVERIL